MTRESFKRKLTAILSADVVGYSRLMADDDIATVRTLGRRREIIAGCIGQYRGRVVDSAGDNLSPQGDQGESEKYGVFAGLQAVHCGAAGNRVTRNISNLTSGRKNERESVQGEQFHWLLNLVCWPYLPHFCMRAGML